MYLELLSRYCAENPYVKPQPPADEEQIQSAEKQLKVTFPEELRQLLLEMNGDRYLCFSAEEIVERNLGAREGLGECYDGLDQLLFIAGNGCGDYYGYRIADGVVCADAIIFWEHETNESRAAAGNLVEMMELYYTDRIQVTL